MEDSVFTKIIKGEIPCHKVYEDDKTIAFLDIFATQPGYTLVVPKSQVSSVWDLSDEDYAAVMNTSREVARHLRQILKVPYVGSKIIGLDVPHAHVHLIPFATSEEYLILPDKTHEPDHQALAAMAQTLAF